MTCPHCQQPIDLQSKAGRCDLTLYSQLAVPLAVAGDIVGSRVQCQTCYKQFVASPSGPLTVPCVLLPISMKHEVQELWEQSTRGVGTTANVLEDDDDDA